MAQTDGDLTPIIRERTEGEKDAYVQGYDAAIRDVERAIKTGRAAIKLVAEVREHQRPVNL